MTMMIMMIVIIMKKMKTNKQKGSNMTLTNVRLDESKPTTDTFLVGVYGTLKKGFHAHGFITADSKSEQLPNMIIPNMQMYNLGSFPGIVPKENSSVEIEVFRLSSSLMRTLDGYEGMPFLYRRYSGLTADNEKVFFYVFNREVTEYPAINSWS